MNILFGPRDRAGEPPKPTLVKIIGHGDLAGDDGEISGQIFAELRGIAKAADAIDALREAGDVERRKVIGYL